MEKEALTTCISLCKRAYEELEIAKDDCSIKVEAAIDALVGQSTCKVKTADKKAIKKIAKAKALDKEDELKREVAAEVDLLEESGVVEHGQLSLFGPLQRFRDSISPGESVTFCHGDKEVTLTN